MKVALVIAVGLAVGCGDGDTRPVQVQLINRGSCSPTNYDLSCMRSLRVQMFTDDQPYRAQCTAVNFATWQALVSSRDTDYLLEDVRARKDVRLEVRGYHNIGGVDPCEDLSDDRLVLWGTSDTVDLTGAGTTTINIHVDCRPKCDCRFMSDLTCAPDLVRGVCAPLLRRTCRERSCDTGCFDELLACNSNICEPDDRGVCDACEGSADCDSSLCVHHTYDFAEYHVDEKFCADAARCPPLEGWAYSCPEGMQCTKLGDGFFDLLP